MLARCIVVVVSLFLTVPGAWAEASRLNILGFNKDGTIFVFEEYGVHDGSGFPYAKRHYIDVVRDAYLSGSPHRLIVQDDTISVGKIRAEVKAHTEKLHGLKDHVLNLEPGALVAFNPLSEIVENPREIAFYPTPVHQFRGEAYKLKLSEKQFGKTDACPAWIDQHAGFELVLSDGMSGAVIHHMHTDKRVPKSRGCALGYRFGGALTFPMRDGALALVALIIVEKVGFEGSDHRWMAVATVIK